MGFGSRMITNHIAPNRTRKPAEILEKDLIICGCEDLIRVCYEIAVDTLCRV